MTGIDWVRLGLRHRDGWVALTGPLARLRRAVTDRLDERRTVTEAETDTSSALLAPALLERSGWLTGFPQLALHAHPADPETGRVLAPSGVLAPAACHSVYAARTGARLPADGCTVHIRSQAFRQEATISPLRRQRAFTMDELVRLGSPAAVADFLAREREILTELFAEWGVPVRWQPATDPFYRADSPAVLLQRIAPVKQEAVFAADTPDALALASVNVHHDHFGTAFDIHAGDGVAHSGCVAVGIERVLWAIVTAHGDDPRDWPPVKESR